MEHENNSSVSSTSDMKVKETSESNNNIISSTASSTQKGDNNVSKNKNNLVNKHSNELKEGATKTMLVSKIARHALAVNNGVVIGDDYPAAWRNNPNQADTWGYATGNCTSLPNFLKAENRKYTYVTNKLQIFLKCVYFYKTKLYNDFGI